MELGEFISESLIQICGGVHNANESIKGNNKGASPFILEAGGDTVDFDVAVVLKSEKSGGGGGKLKLAVFAADVGGERHTVQETASRIRFKVNVHNSHR